MRVTWETAARGTRIKLDGQELRGVVMADDVLGIVERYIYPLRRTPDGESHETETLKGKVEIIGPKT